MACGVGMVVEVVCEASWFVDGSVKANTKLGGRKKGLPLEPFSSVGVGSCAKSSIRDAFDGG